MREIYGRCSRPLEVGEVEEGDVGAAARLAQPAWLGPGLGVGLGVAAAVKVRGQGPGQG